MNVTTFQCTKTSINLTAPTVTVLLSNHGKCQTSLPQLPALPWCLEHAQQYLAPFRFDPLKYGSGCFGHKHPQTLQVTNGTNS